LYFLLKNKNTATEMTATMSTGINVETRVDAEFDAFLLDPGSAACGLVSRDRCRRVAYRAHLSPRKEMHIDSLHPENTASSLNTTRRKQMCLY